MLFLFNMLTTYVLIQYNTIQNTFLLILANFHICTLTYTHTYDTDAYTHYIHTYTYNLFNHCKTYTISLTTPQFIYRIRNITIAHIPFHNQYNINILVQITFLQPPCLSVGIHFQSEHRHNTLGKLSKHWVNFIQK